MRNQERTPLLCMGTTPYAEVFIDAHEEHPEYEFAGFLENMDRAKAGTTLLGLPVLWSDDSGPLAADHAVTCPLATTHRRTWIEDRVGQGFRLASLIHPWTSVSSRATLGDGAIVDPGVVIAGFTHIGIAVRIGRNASIGHHIEIGAYSTIHPAATISSSCRIGEQVTVGTGAVVLEGRSIGDGAFVGAGSVVRRDVPPGALVVGNPARLVREAFGPR